MKNTKKKIFIILPIFLAIIFQVFVFFAPEYVSASSLWDRQLGMSDDTGELAEAFDQTGGVQPLPLVIAKLIRTILGFLGIIFTVLTLIAGFKWMTSQGNDQVISEAKDTIKTTIVGLIIILSAYAIAQMVVMTLYKASTGSIWP